MLNIITRAVKYIVVLVSSHIPYCNQPAPSATIAIDTVSAITVPKLDPGDTSRFVNIEIDMQKAQHPSFAFTDLPYDKTKGMMLMKDDALRSDYTFVFKILSGGTVNGKRYPGFTFTDGAGKEIGYKYSFAINPNEGHTTDINNVSSWAQINEMIAKGHGFMNHSFFHGGTDKLKAIKDAEKNMWRHTHYRMTEIAPPGNDEGYVESGLALGYHMIASEFGEPVPDGNNSPGNENMSWGSYIPMTTQNFKKVLISRTNLGDQWNREELKNAKDFIDYVFTNPNKDKKLIGAAFSHGPFGDKKEQADVFFEFINYIKNHPENHDSAWITSSKDLMDYVGTKAEIVIASQHYDAKTGKFKIVLDMKKVNPNITNRNLSLKVQGGEIVGVKAQGAKEVTFNSKTGLINIYKTDRSKVVDPFKEALPPQIVSTTASGKTLTITYDKPVAQSKAEGYEVTENKVLGLKGNGKIWQLTLERPVTKSQLFYYRIQRGDARQANQSTLRVCTYAGSPIKVI